MCDLRVSEDCHYNNVICVNGIEHAMVLGFWNASDRDHEQYGASDFMHHTEEPEPFTTVWKLLFWRYVLTVFKILAEKPRSFIFCSNPSFFVDRFLQIQIYHDGGLFSIKCCCDMVRNPKWSSSSRRYLSR
ncbi:hypothetical protein Trydic_g1271 [Trypoxylus dichotomus]